MGAGVSLFHSHRWVTTGVLYTPPSPSGSVSRATDELMLLLTQGITNITQRCTRCGRVDVQRHPGRVDVLADPEPLAVEVPW